MSQQNRGGFSLIEAMIAILVIGILAAVAIPNFVAMQDQAKEGATEANMHTFQLAAEDWAVNHDGVYTTCADSVATFLPTAFRNPWNGGTGKGEAWTSGIASNTPVTPGMVCYEATSDSASYVITGLGKNGPLRLTLTSGY